MTGPMTVDYGPWLMNSHDHSIEHKNGHVSICNRPGMQANMGECETVPYNGS